MTFAQLKRFMRKARWGTLATSDGKRVGVRPMGAWVWVGKELWCGAEKGQEKIGQLRNVPYAEYCFALPDGDHVRIAGSCRVSTALTDKTKLYGLVESLRRFYDSPKDEALVVLRMKPNNVRRMDRTTYLYRRIRIL